MNLDEAKNKTLDFLENILKVESFKDLYWIVRAANAIDSSKTVEEVYTHLKDGAQMMENLNCADAATQIYGFLEEISGCPREKPFFMENSVVKSYSHLINKDSDQTRSIEDSFDSYVKIIERDSRGNLI